MCKDDYITELQKAGDILQKLSDDQTGMKRKRGNLAYLLMSQRHDIERIIQYIRLNGLDEADSVRTEDIFNA